MSTTRTFVIVGAGLAGAKAAQALREQGFDGRVVLIGEEQHRPYERPPLSKAYLRGEPDAPTPYVHDEGFYADHQIELLTGTAVIGLDPGLRQVTLADGTQVGFDRLLLTTGSSPRTLPVPGAGLDGVRYLRRLGDSDLLRQEMSTASRLVVVGAGWIGSEVAASARQLDVQVSIVAPDAVPLERVLGTQVGAIYADLHRDHGVDLHLGVGLTQILGTETVQGVRLGDGTTIEGDLVLVGVGATPGDELARQAGLGVDNGILVDEYLQTSAPGIYAAGDVANAWHPLLNRRIRVEHWANAKNQGPVAAANMLDQHTPYAKLPYFYSDQYDLSMEYHGHATDWDHVALRGDPATGEFLAFWTRDGHVMAAMNANIWDQTDQLKALLNSPTPVDPGPLADPTVPLESLVAAAPR